ncbi:hypothetical protein [Sorangium sp. So ce176]|uniref:hypothetical protein n=1 Tax=Sorangium sp. So ce176 TaxID=3133286 RepID=UPI003F636A35
MNRLRSVSDRTNDPSPLPARVRAALAYDAGLYAGALGDLAFACACYEAHNEVAEALADPAPLATGLRTLAYRSMGDVPFARRGLWESEHDLALGRREKAREATAQNIAACRRRGWEGHVAHGHTLLGLALLDGGDGDGGDGAGAGDGGGASGVAAAEAHLGEARRWASATGEVEVALRCHELAARIALARGRPDEGARQALEGLRVAETCGFGPFRARLATLAARCVLGRGADDGRHGDGQGGVDARDADGGPDVAAAAALAGSAVAWAGEDAWARADALHWAGVAAARGGDAPRGRELLAEAAALRERLRHPQAGASREALAQLG